jgi:predicted nucleic acid-binding protein
MLDDRPELEAYRADIAGASVFVSFQTVAELRFGALNRGWSPNRMHALEVFLESLTVVGYTAGLGSHWADVMLAARRSGRRLEAGDAWIAATAMLLEAPLITHDRDFAGIPVRSLSVVCHG